jgi:ubiquinone/menaquinone biosynthesis C-methylase UbiE
LGQERISSPRFQADIVGHLARNTIPKSEHFHIAAETIPVNDDPSGRKAEAKVRFNAAAADYDAGPGAFAHFGRRLVAVAAIAPGNRVLDVASGRGAVLFPAAEQTGVSGDAIGVDFAEEMVRATNEDAVRLGLPVRLQVMDAEHLEFPDATFDRVLCGFGIMFFPNQERALSEFRRVLGPGGRLALSTWRAHQANEVEAALTASGLMPPRFPGWITEPEDLARLLTDAGFSNVRVDTDTHSFRYANADDYWQQARGTGLRRTLDALDAAQSERVHSALVLRMRPYQRPDGYYLAATALLAVANR